MPPAAPGEVSGFEEAKAAARNFSIVVGGPVYDFFLRIGLVRHGLPNVQPRIIAFIAIAWLPLLVLSIKDGLAIGDKVTIPLLLDFSTYGRLLLTLPLLLLAEPLREGEADYLLWRCGRKLSETLENQP